MYINLHLRPEAHVSWGVTTFCLVHCATILLYWSGNIRRTMYCEDHIPHVLPHKYIIDITGSCDLHKRFCWAYILRLKILLVCNVGFLKVTEAFRTLSCVHYYREEWFFIILSILYHWLRWSWAASFHGYLVYLRQAWPVFPGYHSDSNHHLLL